jgi:phosphate uptake regulator
MTLMRGDPVAARAELGSLVDLLDLEFGVADESSLAARMNFAYACGLVGDLAAAVAEIRRILAVCRGVSDLDEMATTARAMLKQLTS